MDTAEHEQLKEDIVTGVREASREPTWWLFIKGALLTSTFAFFSWVALSIVDLKGKDIEHAALLKAAGESFSSIEQQVGDRFKGSDHVDYVSRHQVQHDSEYSILNRAIERDSKRLDARSLWMDNIAMAISQLVNSADLQAHQISTLYNALGLEAPARTEIEFSHSNFNSD